MSKILRLKNALAICFALLASIAWAQERTVSGKVTSAEDGTSIPGVNVVVKGTTNGTTTDAGGGYTLSVSGSATLVFSFIGLKTIEIPIGDRTVIDTAMELDVTQLSEVVVTALGLEVQRDKVGMTSSSIGGSALLKSGETGVLNSMAGKAAGLNITQNSGDPGAGSRIVIRGATSITGGLQPLIIVDGVPYSNAQDFGQASSGTGGVTQQSRLNDINPDDIASLEILKGASAAALWGARAANGVIVITTKKGKASVDGKFTVDFTSRYSVDALNKEVDLQREYGQGTLGRYNGGFTAGAGVSNSWGDRIADRTGGADAFITAPGAGYLGYFETTDGKRYYAIPSGTLGAPHGGKNDKTTYNQHDAIFDNAHSLYNSIGIGTSSKNGNVFLSFSNLNQDGIVKENSSYDRTTARLNATQYINKFTFTTNAAYTLTKADRVQMGSNIDGIMLGGLRTSPDFDNTAFAGTYVDENGNIFANRQRAYRNPLGRRTNSSYDNPVWTFNNNTSTSIVDRITGKVELGYDPTKWLNITGRVSLDTYVDERNDFFDPLSAGSPGGSYTKETIKRNQLQADLFGRAQFKINESIGGSAIVGLAANKQEFSSLSGNITSFVNPLSPPDLGNAPGDAKVTNGTENETRNIAYYSTANFDLYDQVFVNLTGRYEIWSTFPENDNSFFYPAADVAWQFSKLLPSSNVFTFGKLRTGYGKVGRAPGAYVTNTYYISSQYNEGWGGVIDAAQYGGGFRRSGAAGNPNIKPETKSEFEIGADLRFIDDRLTLSGTYYQNTTEDLIVTIDRANSSGYSSEEANGATIENKGVEIELSGEAVRLQDFSWNIGLNWFRNRNEVTEIAGGVQEISLAGFTGSTSSAVLGHQLGVLYGDRWDRDTNGNLELDANGFPQIAATPGVLGDPNPEWRGGITNTFKYKGISLSVLIEHSQGGDIWNGTKGALATFGVAKHTANTVTIDAATAATLRNYNGQTVAQAWPDYLNDDGSYAVRGDLVDFGGGQVLADEQWYRVGLGNGFNGPTEQFIEDATWTRLRELTVSYDLSKFGFWKKAGISGASVSFTGRNLILWTDYTGIDPDTNLSGATNGFGLDYFNNPATKSYQFSLNLKF